jgi:C1A family cysteine protease
MEMIKKHNKDQTKTYKMEMNHFGDLSQEEFSQKVLTPNLKNIQRSLKIDTIETTSNLRSSPASVDWRGKGVVTSVKNQGMCGSCWAFSTAGALEGVVAMKNKTLNNYSEQYLVDCCSYSKYGCQGCSGSWPEWAMEFIRDSGMVLDKDYPYTAVQDKCKGNATAVKLLDHKKAWSLLSNNTETVK